MKRKQLVITLAMLLMFAATACGEENPDRENGIYEEKIEVSRESITEEYESLLETQEYSVSETVEVLETEPVNNTEPAIEETVVTENTEFTFEDLSKRQFGFSSGAGGWGEEFTIEKDGYFTGMYYDSDMGDTGDGYENGTRYFSSYSGHFTNLKKIDEYTYEMTLADISYEDEAGTEEIKDGIRYIYTDAYCLGDNDTFLVYLPGTPLSWLSEEVLMWLNGYNQSETELTMTVIVDKKNEYGIYSHERISPLEDAKNYYKSAKESYDYYSQLVSEGNTTLEIQEYASSMYEISDECLNYLWNLVRYNIEGERYEQILAEQREWIQEKDAKADEAQAEWEGGSFASIIYVDTKAELTMQRCEELVAYLEESLGE